MPLDDRIFIDDHPADFVDLEELYGANVNALYNGARATDRAVYTGLARNWRMTTVPNVASAKIAWDDAGYWLVAASSSLGDGYIFFQTFGPGFTGSFLANTSVARTVTSATSNNRGTFVVGVTPYLGAIANKIFYSLDYGETFTSTAIGSSNTDGVSQVIWSETALLFVALVSPGKVFTSPDGITWTSRTVPGALTAVNWTGLAINNDGLMIAQAALTANYMTSPDGIVWTLRNSGPVVVNNPKQSLVSYSPGLDRFVWGPSPGAYVSQNGLTWTATASDPNEVGEIVGFGPMFFSIASQIGGGGGPAAIEFTYGSTNTNIWKRGELFNLSLGDLHAYAATKGQMVFCLRESGNDLNIIYSSSLGD